MRTSHNFLRAAMLAAAVSAVLLVPAASAAAEGTVEVQKEGPGAATSTVTSEPAGIDCGTECAHEFGIFANVSLTATPAAGYILGGWTVTPESATCPNGSRAATCEIDTFFESTIRVEADFVVQPPPPKASTGESSEVGPHSAGLEGTVNPEGSAVSECYFEYGRSIEYGLTAPCAPANPGSGISTVGVSAALTGLAADTNYHYRLVAVGLGGTVRGEDHGFTTEPATPAVSTQAPEYTQALAHLRDLVNPERSLTSYYFRFGTTTSYGQNVPVTAASAGSGEAPVSISQIVTGLTPGATYHYRLVATNAQGTTTGPDQTFTTLASLPENRAYEMVTPPFKSFNNVSTGTTGNLEVATAATKVIARGGEEILEDSVPFLGTGGVPADEEGKGTYYALERGTSGWTTSSLTAAASVFPISNEELANPANVAEGLWSAATPSQSVYAEDFYLREADGDFVNIGPIAPPSETEGPPHGAKPGTEGLSGRIKGIVGASADLADVVFQMDSPSSASERGFLWPGDGTIFGERPSLYEYAGSGHSGEGADVPALVGVDNNGQQISQCGTGLGADVATESEAVPAGVSRGGSTIFFNARAGGCETQGVVGTGPVANGLYARIGRPGTTQSTVNVAGTSECATSTSCNLTGPVTYQGASSDGSRVFFTTEQALLPSDQDTSNDIYECELPGDNGATPTPVEVVDACPNLKAVSVTGTSSGANVQSVVAVSDEGSRVYFTATGVLTSEPDLSLSSGHQVATEGEDNLYVWEAPSAEHPTGHVAFIATLPGSGPAEAQATPNGRYLVFTTTADLTPDDRSTVAQAFRYDAQTGELVRVSVGQNGFNNDGNTYSNPATLASTKLSRLTLSADGSYVVFQSSDALTPQVQGGLHNAYEWHDGNVYLISDGVDKAAHAGLLGIDASGTNIFFTTSERLVAQDTDENVDIYDARIDGGFPEPTPAPSCRGEACQGPLSAPLASSLLGSTSAPAIGNVPPPVSKPVKPKSLTNPQKLAKALAVCRRDKGKVKRERCERTASRRYGKVKGSGGSRRGLVLRSLLARRLVAKGGGATMAS
jgi:hypothetical protein